VVIVVRLLLIWDSTVVRHFEVALAHFGFHVLLIQLPFAKVKLSFDCSLSQVIVVVVVGPSPLLS
jgi:hypothetical protein